MITENERTSERAYAVQVRDCEEADPELKNVSANDLREKEIATETVLERELHELDYFLETKKHLDRKNVTLCAGSRDVHGSVPDADWCGDKFQVSANWYDPSASHDDLRARAVVSV